MALYSTVGKVIGTVFLIEKYVMLCLPVLFVMVIFVQAFNKRKRDYRETWYKNRKEKADKKAESFIIDYADEYDNWIIAFLIICFFFAVIFAIGFKSFDKKIFTMCSEISIGITGIVVTVLSIAYAVDDRLQLFFTKKDMLRSMRVGYRFRVIMISMFLLLLLSCLDMIDMGLINYGVEAFAFLTFGINIFYNYIVTDIVYKVVFGGDSKEKEILSMLYRVFDVQSFEQSQIENTVNLVFLGKRDLSYLISDYLKKAKRINIDSLEAMKLCISLKSEDKEHRKRWLSKSLHSLSVIYSMICATSIVFYISVEHNITIALLLILFIYIVLFCIMFCCAKIVFPVELQIVSLTAGSYGYNVKYESKEVAVGINSVRIFGLDKKYRKFIQARNSIIAMFWILSQNIKHEDRKQLFEIIKAGAEFLSEYDQDLVLLPLYLSEFFVWRNEKESYKNEIIYKEKYKNEKIRKMMDNELFVLLRHIEDNQQLYKKDLEEFFSLEQ